MTSPRLHPLLTLGAAIALMALPPFSATTSADDQGNSSDRQTICHATHADTNPYRVITPNKNADVGGHARHTGPLWVPGLKAAHVQWGDVIPPFDYVDHGVPAHFAGLNWTATGQAWFANDCRVPISATVDKTNDADGDDSFTDNETATSVGAAVPFTVVVTNTSVVAAIVTGVSDAVGEDAITFTATPNPVGTTLEPGASLTFTFTVADYTPADGESITNVVTVTLARVGDPTNTASAQDPSTVSTQLPPPDVAVVKTGTATASPGDDLTYTITVTNTGVVPASGVQVTDALPAGTTLVSATGDGWTVSGTTELTLTYGSDLAVGASASVTIVATLDAAFTGTTVSNTAVVTPEDVTPEDNTSTAITDVVQPGGGGGGGAVVTPPPFTGGGGGAVVTPPPFTGGGGGAVTLPRTGAPVWNLLAAGLILLLTGIGLNLVPEVSRRRI